MSVRSRKTIHTISSHVDLEGLDLWPGDVVVYMGRRYVVDGLGVPRAIQPGVSLPNAPAMRERRAIVNDDSGAVPAMVRKIQGAA